MEAEDADGNAAYDYAFITVRPGIDHFADRTPVTGGEVLVSGNNHMATREPGEPTHAGGFGNGSVWWSWTAPESGPVTVTAIAKDRGSYNAGSVGVYTGSALSSLSVVASNAFGTPFGSRATFNALAGTAYQIAVDGWEGGPLQLAVQSGAPPAVTLTRPTDGEVFMRGEAIIFEACATSSDGTIVSVAFHAATWSGTVANPTSHDHGVVGSVLEPPYQWNFSPAESETFFSVRASALDSRGLVGYSEEVYFEVQQPPPPNDDLADAIELIGSSASSRGTNRGAAQEPNEPYHAGKTGGRSVWWTWRSPYTTELQVEIDRTEFISGRIAYGFYSYLPNAEDEGFFDNRAGEYFSFGSAGIAVLTVTNPPPPRILADSLQKLPDGQFRFLFAAAAANSVVDIFGSTDLSCEVQGSAGGAGALVGSKTRASPSWRISTLRS